jgi:hypothetical protein
MLSGCSCPREQQNRQGKMSYQGAALAVPVNNKKK